MRRRGAVRRIAAAAAGACAGLAAGTASAGESSPDLPTSSPDAAGGEPALKHSDVVFMYEAKADTYAAYGATVLAWGGEPTPESLKAAVGAAWHGSVGMVTEFGAYHDRFPQTWQAGLCRDVH